MFLFLQCGVILELNKQLLKINLMEIIKIIMINLKVTIRINVMKGMDD